MQRPARTRTARGLASHTFLIVATGGRTCFPSCPPPSPYLTQDSPSSWERLGPSLRFLAARALAVATCCQADVGLYFNFAPPHLPLTPPAQTLHVNPVQSGRCVPVHAAR
jgi:hypothetical protein